MYVQSERLHREWNIKTKDIKHLASEVDAQRFAMHRSLYLITEVFPWLTGAGILSSLNYIGQRPKAFLAKVVTAPF